MHFRGMFVRWRWASAVVCAVMAMATPVRSQTSAPAEEPPPKFSKSYLGSKTAINSGKTVWANQCRHCHGNAAYPGKAPKLNPGGMTPDFIYDRVTYGFRKMPPWKEIFSLDERKAVVAYIKSDSFSP